MLLSLVGLVIMGIFWLHSDHEAPVPTQSDPPIPKMSEIIPGIPPHPTVTYRITRLDLLVNHLTLWMRNRVLQLILPLYIGWRLWAGLSRDFEYTSTLGLVMRGLHILAFSCMFLAGTFILVGMAMSFLLKQRGVVCEHVLEITDEGLLESTEMNRTLHKWSSVCRIMNIFGYLFVYVGDQTSHQIPRRCVPPEQMAAFEIELRARAAAAR